jgi:hypothetical protein
MSAARFAARGHDDTGVYLDQLRFVRIDGGRSPIDEAAVEALN